MTVARLAERLVLLPALDGTGRMFSDFIESLGTEVAAQAIAYPATGPQDYESLAGDVTARIPGDAPYVLLGESFAGPLAYRIAGRDPRCRGVVFVATYLTDPSPFLVRLLTWTPAALLSFAVRRPFVVRFASLSRASRRRVATAIAENFGHTLPDTLKARLRVIQGERKPPEHGLELPCLYLRARSDRLVRPDKLPDFERLCPRLTVRTIEGGHFVVQENPTASATEVLEFLGSAASIPDPEHHHA